LTEKILGARNFNFAPTFTQNAIHQPKFCIFGKTFSNTKEIFRQAKIYRAISPCRSCHDDEGGSSILSGSGNIDGAMSKTEVQVIRRDCCLQSLTIIIITIGTA